MKEKDYKREKSFKAAINCDIIAAWEFSN